ncbi:MAG TPA: helix-hairpin-helix domain-containing protein, partial [Verrucomicrobiae bacterium]|nr:helix-hairpin-helix domain-containing protein [Verrucomicrobiae bacterium]
MGTTWKSSLPIAPRAAAFIAKDWRGCHDGSLQPAVSKPPESLAGLIERVTFFNEENGFSVLKVKCRGERELVTVVGTLPSVNAGEWLAAEGRWARDREFGLQFRADALKTTPPTSLEGIEKYLASGMVKGIGPVYAKKLVRKFGEKIFDIIETESGRLEDVEGIGPQRRQRIKAAWAEQKAVREIMVFLHSNGVSTSRATRIYKVYGTNAIEEVRANPYKLARDIHGIGFKTADDIARKVGIPHDSLARASAGLEYVLLEAGGRGHCALPSALLKDEAVKLLQIPEEIVSTALQRSLEHKEIAIETIDGQELVFPPKLQAAEQGIAARLKGLCEGTPPYPPIDIEKAVVWCEKQTGQALAASQREALKRALSSRLLVITGGPGVGKTTLVNALLRILRAKRVKCLLCAPTGR